MNDARDKAIEAAITAAQEHVDAHGLDLDPVDGLVRDAIAAYEAALIQPIRTAKKDGCHVLGWHAELKQWCKVRCVQGQPWPSGITMWQPMPPAIEEETTP
jgi:hypothetical protein